MSSTPPIPARPEALRAGRNADGMRATLVMTARERHGLTERAIDSIVRNTRGAYRLIYASGATPPPLLERLRGRQKAWNLEIADVEPGLWPNQIRRRLVAGIDTDYAVFLDNDVDVQPGWLDALIACADETGAGAVGPLYLIAGDDDPPVVHMAGGSLVWEDTPQGRVLHEEHVDVGADPEQSAAMHQRAPCDFLEYHCMLVRTSLARDGSLFDPAIVCVHEHIDLAVTLHRQGYRTWSEPAARVTYLARAAWTVDDLDYMRWRWSRAAGDASIAAFCRKWGVIDDGRSFGGVRAFLRVHKARLDPLREESAGRPALAEPMRAGDLPQTRAALLDLAIAQGWSVKDLAALAQRYDVAAILANGGYRPCGRPFIAHLVGTAGVLLRYGFRPDIVHAGLLHAAYSHCPEFPPGQKSSIETVCDALGGAGAPLERLVRSYTRLADRLGDLVAKVGSADSVTVDDAILVAMAAANEIDMALGGEYKYTMRAPGTDDAARALVRRVSGALGVPGLAATLDAVATPDPVPRELKTGAYGSYRIDGLRRVPMPSRAFEAFDRRAGDTKVA